MEHPFMLFVFFPALIGSVTGFVSHLIANDYISDFPKKVEGGIYWGFLAHMGIGALSALVAVNLIVPGADGLRTVIGISILAGISGEALLLKHALATEREKNKKTENVESMLDKELSNKK